MKQRIVIGSDHAGYTLKEFLKNTLESEGHDVVDKGTDSEESVDYPPIIHAVCHDVLEHGGVGIVLGGSGNGEAMAANKVAGIRCALVYSDETATLARAHNDANVMSLGGRLTTEEDAKRFVDIFLETPFDGGRHERRIAELEESRR